MLLQLLKVAFGISLYLIPFLCIFFKMILIVLVVVFLFLFVVLFFAWKDVMYVLASQKWIRPLVSHVSKSTNYKIFQLLEL
jgi:hypothetical protein